MIDLPELPEALQAFAKSKGPSKPRGEKASPGTFPPASDAILAKARSAVANRGPAVEGARGDQHTYSVAAILINDYALSHEEAWPILLEWNKTCRPPWGEDELHTKMENALSYASSPLGGERRAQEAVAPFISAPKELSDDELRAQLKAVRLKLARKSDPQAQLDADMLKKTLAAEVLQPEQREHAAAALKRHGVGVKDSQLIALLTPSAGSFDRAKEAIEAVQPKEDAESDLAGFSLDPETGRPYPTQANIDVALDRLGVALKHDLFSDRDFIELSGAMEQLDDAIVRRLWLETDSRFRFKPTKEFYWDVIVDRARQNSFHPVLEYLDSLSWDGVPRIDLWLTTYGGAEDTEYTRAVGRLMLVAAVRRVRSPGAKFDEMPILEGEQGTDKSSALKKLAVCDEWFTDDLPLNAETKVVIERLAGKWIVEAGELKGMRKSEVNHLKGFVSRQVDEARLSYGRLTTRLPRQCVIIGTTNDAAYLKDPTGDRRFWPVQVVRFDLSALGQDRDQLWAEAAHREATGESIRLDPSLYEAARLEQDGRRVEDAFEAILSEVFGDNTGRIRTLDIWEILGIEPAKATQEQNTRLGEVMRGLGWERPKMRRRVGGKHRYVYEKGTHEERESLLLVAYDIDPRQPAFKRWKLVPGSID